MMAANHNDEPSNYRPTTLNARNAQRLQYLPICPTTSTSTLLLTLGIHDHLLLANVPENQLSSEDDLHRRQQAVSLPDLFMLTHDDDAHDNDEARQSFYLLSDDRHQLAIRLRVPDSILTWNVQRLSRICQRFVQLRHYFRHEMLLRDADTFEETALTSKEMSIALEFFLQIDVDVFYMKTCMFLGAQPRPTNSGLFCTNDGPQARYALVPCAQDDCPCCHIIQHPDEDATWSVIDVAQSSTHRFLNGYTTYLNCPVSCLTSNIIYAMTCPCGQYEYIGSTPETLTDALLGHRLDINKMMHSILTGSSVHHELLTQNELFEHRLMKRMRLYQHSARCSVALQLFLNRNPHYWCFIPLSIEQVRTENHLFLQEVETINAQLILNVPKERRMEKKLVQYQSRIPRPSIEYKFSRLQQQQQRLCFDEFLDTPVHEFPYKEVDLYQMKIIAALPANISPLLLYIIETLFIIHAETKLNMICPIGHGIDIQRHYDQLYDVHCYSRLTRALPITRESIRSTINMVQQLNQRLFNRCRDNDDD